MEIIKFLETKKFQYIKALGKGTYGDVHEMVHPNKNKYALKFVESDKLFDSEILLWPYLKHPNILELVECFQIPHISTYVLAMPVLQTNMLTVVRQQNFMSQTNSLLPIRSWFKDILSGIQYLHELNLAHLDIKADNILIDGDMKAVLCDFTFLSSTSAPLDRWGTPRQKQPPEACKRLGYKAKVDGCAFDMWTTGILVLNVLTGHVSNKIMNLNPRSWIQDNYPALFAILQENSLKYFISKSLPECNIDEKEMRNIRNFILMFLHLKPENRPTAKQALSHSFLQSGKYVNTVDVSWKKQTDPLLIRTLVLDFHQNLEKREVVEDIRLTTYSREDVCTILAQNSSVEKDSASDNLISAITVKDTKQNIEKNKIDTISTKSPINDKTNVNECLRNKVRKQSVGTSFDNSSENDENVEEFLEFSVESRLVCEAKRSRSSLIQERNAAVKPETSITSFIDTGLNESKNSVSIYASAKETLEQSVAAEVSEPTISIYESAKETLELSVAAEVSEHAISIYESAKETLS